MDNSTGNITLACALPAYCSQAASNHCLETPLISCQHCSFTSAFFLLFFIPFVGFSVVISNLLVIAIVCKAKPSDRRKVDYVKASLAVSDVINGLDALFVTFRYGVIFLYSSVSEMLEIEVQSRGSIEATILGVVNYTAYSVCNYHLLYMSMQRFAAVNYPFKYNALPVRSVYIHLIFVWCFSIAWGLSPVYFYNDSEFQMFGIAFQFLPQGTLETDLSQTRTLEDFVFVAFYFVPFVLVATLTCITSRVAWNQRKNFRHIRQLNTVSNFKKEMHLLKMTAFMVLGCSVGIVPVLLVTVLTSVGLVPCELVSTSYFICYTLLVSSGLINVMVYSAYDESFQNSVKKMWNKKESQ